MVSAFLPPAFALEFPTSAIPGRCTVTRFSFCQILPFFVFACAIIGGIITWAIGAPISYGIAMGMAIGFSPLFLLALLVGFMQLWRPDCPRCMCGTRLYDYVTTIKPDERNTSTWTYQYRCRRCDRNFVQSAWAFEIIGENGVPGPYMVHSNLGRWHRAR